MLLALAFGREAILAFGLSLASYVPTNWFKCDYTLQEKYINFKMWLINPSIRIENLPDMHNIDKRWCIQQQRTDYFPRWFYNVQTYLIKILILVLFLNENFQMFWRNSCAWLTLSSIFYHLSYSKKNLQLSSSSSIYDAASMKNIIQGCNRLW